MEPNHPQNPNPNDQPEGLPLEQEISLPRSEYADKRINNEEAPFGYTATGRPRGMGLGPPTKAERKKLGLPEKPAAPFGRTKSGKIRTGRPRGTPKRTAPEEKAPKSRDQARKAMPEEMQQQLEKGKALAKLQAQRNEMVREFVAKSDNPWIKHKAVLNPRGFTVDKMKVWADTFAKTGRKTDACKAAGVALITVTEYIQTDPFFQNLYNNAKEVYRDTVAKEVYRRAIEGVDKAVIGGQFKDQIVHIEKQYSDRLLELEAKRVDPSYREKATGIDVNVKQGGVLVIAQTSDKINVEDWESQFSAVERKPDLDFDAVETLDITPESE